MLNDILTKQTLIDLVDKLVRVEKLSYIEAVLHVCHEREIDPLDIGKLIGPVLKEKIRHEAISANLLPGESDCNLSSFL
jgi:hypothetical protein